MDNFVGWLGPSLRRFYRESLMLPANWRMIMMLSSLDEQAERKAEEDALKAEQIAGKKQPGDGRS